MALPMTAICFHYVVPPVLPRCRKAHDVNVLTAETGLFDFAIQNYIVDTRKSAVLCLPDEEGGWTETRRT